MNFLKRITISILLFCSFGLSHADPGCNDAQIFSTTLLKDICWTCMLPVRVMGGAILTGSDVPPAANTDATCSCADPHDPFGIPAVGISFGAWLPYRLMETTRNPYCMPTFGGIFLNHDYLNLAGPMDDPSEKGNNTNFLHSHIYSFPLATMMELMTNATCNPGGYMHMDLIGGTEYDPSVNDDLMALFLYPETAMFANPLAIAACAIECGKISTGLPASGASFWCAGCWGSLYPLTNSSSVSASVHLHSSSVSARQLAVMHRRGLGHKTYGSGTSMCGGTREVFLPKEQYKWQHLFPVVQASGNCCHWTGANEYVTGGVSRNRPSTGEDVVQLLYRYVDCCLF